MQASPLLANILLSIATLIFILLVGGIYLKPMPGGDYRVGYAWSALILNLAFILLIGLSMLAIGWRGGFQWVAAGSDKRLGLLLLGFLVIAITVGASGMGEGSGWIARVLTIAMPMAVLTTGYLLANDNLAGGVPASIARWMTLLVFGVSGVFASVFVVASMMPRLQGIFHTLTYDRSKLDSFEEGILVNIDNCDLSKDMMFLLIHTDANRKGIIRERALAKIKTRPDWQEELVRGLEVGWTEEVFTFLASNEVENKSLFPEPVRRGVLKLAELVRKAIKESRELSAGQYTWEVDRVLRTVDKYTGMGVDYLPAVRELRAAFDQSSPFTKPALRAAKMLDKWIKKRQG